MTRNLGIIGCGAVTQNNYVKALPMFPDIKVKAVYDLDEKQAISTARQLNSTFTSKDNLLSICDIIIIATPPFTHRSLIEESLSKGKIVICEKPFVGTSEEAVYLVNLADKSQAKLYVAHFRRLFPSVSLAKEIVQSKLLGDILSVEVYEGGRFSWQTKSGYVYNDPFGGVVFDTGSHAIDMALFVTGLDNSPMVLSNVVIKKDKAEPSHEVFASMLLDSADQKFKLSVKFSRKILLANKIRITGSNGYLDIPTGLSNYVRLGTKYDSFMIYSNTKYDDLMDCFAMQFKFMFYPNENSIFDAARFINLSNVLEAITKD
jgi:predicted dehydrogenase